MTKHTKIIESCKYCNELAVNIHHIDRNRKNNDLNNLVHLCVSCHKKEHNDGIDDESSQYRIRDLCDLYKDNTMGYRLMEGYFLLNENEKVDIFSPEWHK